jgi:cysteine desulfurase / selenocysteine lyase
MATVGPWQDKRDQIPAASKGVYLDNAATSPLPDPVREAVAASMLRRAEAGEGFFDEAVELVEDVRRKVGAHLRLHPEGVAFMKNTGEAINHVARSMPLSAGQNIVTTALEFPTNLLPWRALERKGVELRIALPDDQGLGVSPESLAQQVDADTALVSMSWVTFQTGYRHDVEEFVKIAKENDALLLVDGIQGLGALEPPVMRDVDAFACGGHKWLMAPFGVGFLWLRPELAREWDPDHVGWWSLEDYEDFTPENTQLAASARRFEIGNLAFDLIAGLGAALDFLPPAQQVEARVLEVAGRLHQALDELPGEVASPALDAKRSGIVLWRREDAVKMHARLSDAGVSTSLRAGALRFSPHFWALEEEVDRVVELVG